MSIKAHTSKSNGCSNGHIAHRGEDAASEGSPLLQMTDGDPDAERSDVHHSDEQEDASAILAPTPPASLLPEKHDAPVSSIGKIEAGESTTSPTPRPAPDSPINPVEASITVAPNPSVETGGKPPAPGTLLVSAVA